MPESYLNQLTFKHTSTFTIDIYNAPDCFKKLSVLIYHHDLLLAMSYERIICNGGGHCSFQTGEFTPGFLGSEDVIITTREIFSKNKRLRRLKQEQPDVKIYPFAFVHLYAIINMAQPDNMQAMEMTLDTVPEVVDLVVSDTE